MLRKRDLMGAPLADLMTVTAHPCTQDRPLSGSLPTTDGSSQAAAPPPARQRRLVRTSTSCSRKGRRHGRRRHGQVRR